MQALADQRPELLGCEQQASVVAGSESTFRALVVEHAPYVWRVLRSLGVPDADLPDASQETFLIVHRKLPGFEARSSLRSWIYGIALRVASDFRDKQRRKPRPMGAASDLPEVWSAPGQQEHVERSQAWQLIEALLAGLDEDLRRVFVLFELEQLPMREVAQVVGCPLSTAYWRLHTARARVEALLAERRQEAQR
jgi:RNA polymerase sigma-70 factor (ECF subfamily)